MCVGGVPVWLNTGSDPPPYAVNVLGGVGGGGGHFDYSHDITRTRTRTRTQTRTRKQPFTYGFWSL